MTNLLFTSKKTIPFLPDKFVIAQILRRLVPHEWGGTEGVVTETSKKLQQHGHKVKILTTSTFSRPGKDVIEDIPLIRFSYQYPIFPLSSHRRKQMDKKGGNPLSFSLFWYLLKNQDIQLIHLHTVGRLAAQVRAACKIRDIPYVISLHGGHFSTPKSELEYFASLNIGCLDYGKVWGALFGSRKVLADAAAIICVGHDEYVQTQKAFPNKKVVYFPNGVNPDVFLSGNGDRIRQTYKLENKKIILCVGRIDPQKNQLALIKALSSIKKFCPDAYLVLVGAVTVSNYWERLKAEIKTKNLEPFVKIVAGLPPSALELKDWYVACDVFVLPSIHEPFGIVVLEAWACSKPVIVSQAGNLQILVQDGVNGVHLRNDSPQEMASTIGKILLDDGYAAKLGRAGRQTLEEHYTWDHIIQKLEGLYEEALQSRVKYGFMAAGDNR